jgi:hypothetical protein
MAARISDALRVEQFEAMDLGWPPATFDAEEQRARLSDVC